MYLDFLVKVPTVKGKITRRKKSNVVYIEYEYDRVYDPSRKYTFPKRVTIGKLSDTDPEFMKPNQNFLYSGVRPYIEKIKKLNLFGKFSKENIKIAD